MRRGLAIELTIESLFLCKTAGTKLVGIWHFADAFTNLYGMPNQFTPFKVEECWWAFDPDKLFLSCKVSTDHIKTLTIRSPPFAGFSLSFEFPEVHAYADIVHNYA